MTIRQAEKVSQVGSAAKISTSPLYSEIMKSEKRFDKKKTIKNAKITKWCHGYRVYVSTYSAEILNSFNPDLQLKDTESAIRNKLKDLILNWKGLNRDDTGFRVS